jgi:serine/threonine protein kinase
MPIEQLNGKPRFSSDIYALGMMIIQAITGAEPRLFAEHPETAELIWRDRLSQGNYSPQFLDTLDKMVRYDFRQRYQTANEVLEAIAMLPSATEHALPTTLLHGGNNNSVSNLATVVVSPQGRSPYAQDEHPSQLHTVAFQKSSPRQAFPLWMWISGGALLLLLTIMAIIGKSMKNVPEVINTPSPKVMPTTSPTVTPTATPIPTVIPTPTATLTPTATPLPIPAPEFQPQPQDIPAPLVDRQPPSKKGGKKK